MSRASRQTRRLARRARRRARLTEKARAMGPFFTITTIEGKRESSSHVPLGELRKLNPNAVFTPGGNVQTVDESVKRVWDAYNAGLKQGRSECAERHTSTGPDAT